MTRIFARRAKLADAWAHDVLVEVKEGRIASIESGAEAGDQTISVDTLLPALSNLHSHSFQRAMAGMTEYRTAGRDSFWTWRELMYRFAQEIAPEEVEAIAALAFMEMLEAGFAAVGEFHYLHHQKGGAQYSSIDELSQRVFAAAQRTGIGLTHLPVFYAFGGAGEKPLADEQLRFGNNLDQYVRLVEAAAAKLPDFDARIGAAPHSLRATSPDGLRRLLDIYSDRPVHIHIAEQPKEVEDICAWLGARPVEWLLREIGVNEHWCAVHATHMTQSETRALAQSGAVAGLCPITEANLGDGPFNGEAFLEAGGEFGIGTDSNVRISMVEELRLLEYSQRLRDGTRNVLCAGGKSVGETIYERAAFGGAKALGRQAGAVSIGALADLVAINTAAPSLFALNDRQVLDGVCFAAGDDIVTDLWSAGRHMVRGGRHIARDAIVRAYKASMTRLMERA